MSTSLTFSIVMNQPSTAPAWFTALPYSQWTLINSASSMQGVSSGVAARTLTMPWIGAAVDQTARKFVIANPGGHNDGGSNAVYEWRAADASPNWYRTRAGTVVGYTPDAANSVAVDASGQPTHTHSYHRPLVAAGRFWLPGIDSGSSSNGFWSTATVSYDLSQTSNGVWRSHGRLTTGSIPKWLGGSAAYDSINNRIFSFPQAENSGPGYYFNVSTVLAAADSTSGAQVSGSTAINGPGFGSWVYSASVVSVQHARLIFCAFSDTGGFSGIRSLQLNNLGAGWTSHTISGTAPFNVYGGGFVRHESANRFYSYGSSGNMIRVFDVPATVTNAWTSRSVTLGGATAPGTQSDNGSQGFSRFNIIQDMGNGEACLLWYPTHTLAGMYACRVPVGGL